MSNDTHKKLRELARACDVDAPSVADEHAFYDAVAPDVIIALLDQLQSATRELERWRHGQQIEGDYVCPDSLELTETKARLEEVTKARDELADVAESLRVAVDRADAWEHVVRDDINHKQQIVRLRKAGAQ